MGGPSPESKAQFRSYRAPIDRLFNDDKLPWISQPAHETGSVRSCPFAYHYLISCSLDRNTNANRIHRSVALNRSIVPTFFQGDVAIFITAQVQPGSTTYSASRRPTGNCLKTSPSMRPLLPSRRKASTRSPVNTFLNCSPGSPSGRLNQVSPHTEPIGSISRPPTSETTRRGAAAITTLWPLLRAKAQR